MFGNENCLISKRCTALKPAVTSQYRDLHTQYQIIFRKVLLESLENVAFFNHDCFEVVVGPYSTVFSLTGSLPLSIYLSLSD